MKRPRLAVLLFLGSCAVAGSDDGSDNITPPAADARIASSFPDSGPVSDAAPTPIDAAPLPVDAASTGADAGLFCDNSGQCTQANTCCFSLGGPGFCVPGEEVIGVCLPD